ncbi:hypothetical protein HZB02_06135 [Candidatus Woesearchaeota archaeon]|nr:hypothetical protein [Candidatus Woesearchaeota archaeon]
MFPLTKRYQQNPKGRFSDRVADYVKYRSGYPAEILSFLEHQHDGKVIFPYRTVVYLIHTLH